MSHSGTGRQATPLHIVTSWVWSDFSLKNNLFSGQRNEMEIVKKPCAKLLNICQEDALF